jgi:hypothetical protein
MDPVHWPCAASQVWPGQQHWNDVCALCSMPCAHRCGGATQELSDAAKRGGQVGAPTHSLRLGTKTCPGQQQ